MIQLLNRLWPDEAGQDVAEYALLLVLICLTAVTAMGAFATSVSSLYSSTSTQVVSVTNSRSDVSSLAGTAESIHTNSAAAGLSGKLYTKKAALDSRNP